MLTALALFAGMCVAYVVLGINIRALAKGKLLETGVTEFTYAMLNFFIIQRVAVARTVLEAIAYAAGATAGCLTSIYVTQHWEV